MPLSGAEEAAAFEREVAYLSRPPFLARTVRFFSTHGLELFFRLYNRMSVHGKERIPLEGPVLVVCNHASDLDPLVLGSFSRRQFSYMAKDTLFRIPVIGRWCRAVGAFAVKRGAADRRAMELAIRLVQERCAVLIFPEGTRSRDGRLQKAQPGAAMLAVRMGDVPIVPIRLDGTFAALPPGARFPRPRKIRVHVGRAFRIRDLAGLPADKKALYRALAETIIKAIGEADEPAEPRATAPRNH
jgi:1-acyl-sn-glycerol-3-phosphate acyltransferase